MKRFGIMLVLFAALLLAVGVACQAPAQAPPPAEIPKPAAKPIQLRMATQDPAPNAPLPDSYQWFAEEVTKRTEGRVQVEVIWGGALLAGTETLEGVQAGTADVGVLIAPYHPGQLPLHTADSSVPFTTPDPVKALDIARRLYEQVPELLAEIERFNQTMVSLSVTPSYGLWSVKPIRSLADIKGMKIRSLGAYLPKILTAAGAEPVSMPGNEIYTAMQRGTIHAASWPLEFGTIFKLQEVAKHYSEVDFGVQVLSGGITFNKDVWQKIPAQDQEIIRKVGREREDRLAQRMKEFIQKLEESLTKEGVKIADFPAGERQKWANLPEVKTLGEQWVQEMEGKGLPGKKLMDLYLKLEQAQ